MTGRPIFLTIDDVTRNIREWSRQPGAAKYHTIAGRVKHGWDARDAVFGALRKKPTRGSGRAVRIKRPPVVLAPPPDIPAEPFRPTLGSFKSYSTLSEARESLRRS